MVYLTFSNKNVNFSDEIFKISTILDELAKYRIDENEPIPVFDIDDEIFEIFSEWFNDLNEVGIVKLDNITFKNPILFEPEFFTHDMKTLIKLYNFGLSTQIKILCDTIAYVISLRNIWFEYEDSKIILKYNFQNKQFQKINLSASLTISILNNLDIKKINRLDFNIKSLLKEKTKAAIPYTNYINEITEDDIIYDVCGQKVSKGIVTYDNKFIKLESFIYPNSLKIITLPYSVKCSCYAFRQCDNLQTVILPKKLQLPLNNVFIGCDKLNLFHNNILYRVSTDVTTFTFPDNTYEIHDFAFQRCNNLSSIEIPSSVTRISNYAFTMCSKLSSIKILNPNIEFGKSCFENCLKLNFIHKNTLYRVSSNTLDMSIYDGIRKIAGCCFYNCREISNIQIPSSVQKIGELAFCGCVALTNINIPNGVKIIPYNCFKKCFSLQYIEIPSTVTKFEKYCFQNCHNLKSIDIPSSVVSIETGAFEHCTSLKTIVIPNSVTRIDSAAFDCCYELTNIVLSNSITDIKDFTFSRCEKLCSITIPTSVSEILDYVFYECTSLSSIEIPSTIKYLDKHTFYGCNSLDLINNELFNIPKNIVNYVLSTDIDVIYSYSFNDFTALKSIEIPTSVTRILSSAFANCSKLEFVSLPTSINTIESYTFENCTSLQSITIPSSVTSIKEYAFKGCSNLSNIEIQNKAYVDHKAFKGTKCSLYK